MPTLRLVLDCSALLPGPFVGKLLARQGCRVIKVESPERPDPAREMQPSFYADLNGCKEPLTLSLVEPGDRARFEELLREADGLIEGFRPAAKRRLGLDEATLHAINPRLCIASLVGYPSDGAWKDRAGHDLNFQAVTGCLSLFDRMPALPLADLFASYEAALGLMAAMDEVSRALAAGRAAYGRRVESSMSGGLLQAQSMLLREHADHGTVPRYGETLFSGKFPAYREYLAGDGRRVSMGAIEAKFWTKACAILGVPHLSDEGMTEGDRGRQVAAEVARAFATRPWAEWAPLFETADCCVEPVLTFAEIRAKTPLL